MKHIITTKHIKTTLEAYKQYVDDNGTDRVAKGVKLHASKFTRNHPLMKHLNEIKFTPLYTLYNKTNTTIGGDDLIIFTFSCDSGYQYRLDLLEIESETYWLDKKHYNVSFSLIERDDIVYDDPTYYGELFEIFKRIMFILKEFSNENIDFIYVVGSTLDKRKNLLYKDFIDSFDNCIIKNGKSNHFGENTYYIKNNT